MAEPRNPDLREPPAPVAALAAERAFGAYLDQRGWGDPWKNAGLGLLAVVAAVLGEIVIHVVGLLFLHLVMLMLFVGGLANAISALVRGRRESYLFAGGLVHSDRKGLVAVAWPQVARLGRSVGEHRLTGGRRFPLHLQGGRTIDIPLVQRADGTDPFMRRLADLLRQYGRPVE